MTQPTGVFVRLPLSSEQVLAILDSYTGDKESTDAAMQKTILSLGTPVTGGKLEKLTHSLLSAGIRQALAPNWTDGLFAMHAKADLMAQEIMTENPSHQAAIAALEAEVGRLHGVLLESLCALTSVTDNCHDIIQNDIYAECEEAILSARAVMKGPEA